MSLLTSQNSASPNFLELAALVVPQRNLGLKHSLRRACGFLPMPLCLGWDADPAGEQSPPDIMVAGLLLSDMASGATRAVEAPWMHALYKHSTGVHPPGTVVMNLREAGYASKFGVPHVAIVGTLFVQMFVVLVFLAHGHRREGVLLVVAGVIRILEGFLAWTYPTHKPPREQQQRFCALHTGATTKQILVITHRFSGLKTCVNFEDAAAPWEWRRGSRAEFLLRGTFKICVWLQRGACLATTANGFLIPSVLLFGTAASELVSAWADLLPVRHTLVLDTENPMLDRIVAACQFANTVSVGFVESILPDPQGSHADYTWISTVLRPWEDLAVHPNHPEASKVLKSALRRRHSRRSDSPDEAA
ncbi:hypothetical protein C8F04DRAFT_1396704 [Mycena alexandri]|uniref:Uncharacterized protein n=1 Tax=Mycena alexandri TaxID=1745969 RepID=A0AAD6SQW0_9AGAR|nr:hypothetical protein C8F04DRAFT_1396704 [Mycena alexandri]